MEPLQKKDRRSKVDVDGKHWFPMPTAMMRSAAYIGLSDAAKVLLFELAFQYVGTNNGLLVLSRSHLADRGILSADRIQRAKAELLAAGLIHQTVMGQRPNKASRYAVTWWALDKSNTYDIGAALLFVRSAYRATEAKPKRPPPANAKPKKNATLVPATGHIGTPIAPAPGTRNGSPVPATGAIRPELGGLSVPATGNLLEVTSTAAPAAAASTKQKRTPGRKRNPIAVIAGTELPRLLSADGCGECGAAAGELHYKGCEAEPCPFCTSASWLKCMCGHEAKPGKRAQFHRLPKSTRATAEAAP